jgi:hypothetical protein
MSAALRLVDPVGLPTLSPASLATPRSSLRPTLVPRALAMAPPSLRESFETQPPLTQRSATVLPRGAGGGTQLEAYNLLAVMRLNVDFLESLLANGAPVDALEAFADLHRSIDRLELRCASLLPIAAPRIR